MDFVEQMKQIKLSHYEKPDKKTSVKYPELKKHFRLHKDGTLQSDFLLLKGCGIDIIYSNFWLNYKGESKFIAFGFPELNQSKIDAFKRRKLNMTPEFSLTDATKKLVEKFTDLYPNIFSNIDYVDFNLLTDINLTKDFTDPIVLIKTIKKDDGNNDTVIISRNNEDIYPVDLSILENQPQQLELDFEAKN